MTIEAIVLTVSALVFVGVAVQGLFLPWRIVKPLGGKLETPSMKNEMRANYGGMHLGMAVLLGIAVAQPQWQTPALALLLAFAGGLVGGRIVSMAVDGVPNRFVLVFTGLEAIGAIAAALLLFGRP